MPDGTEYPQKETDKKLEEIVGLTKEQFMQVAMIAQGEFMEMLRARSDDKKEIFRKLFHTRLYQDIAEELSRRKKAREKEVEKIRTVFQTEAAHVAVPGGFERAGEWESVKQRMERPGNPVPSAAFGNIPAPAAVRRSTKNCPGKLSKLWPTGWAGCAASRKKWPPEPDPILCGGRRPQGADPPDGGEKGGRRGACKAGYAVQAGVRKCERLPDGSGNLCDVTELKQEIDDQLIVRKDEEGSHVRWQIS